MRVAAVAVALLLAACPSDDEPAADAALDATDGGADAIDAISTDAAPGELDGEWAVDWTCTSSCFEPRPGLTYSHRLTITTVDLAWHDELCGDCNRRHVGTQRAECLDVAAAVDSIDIRDAYSLCSTGPADFTTDLMVRRLGGHGDTTTWHAAGRRL